MDIDKVGCFFRHM